MHLYLFIIYITKSTIYIIIIYNNVCHMDDKMKLYPADKR